MMSPSRQTLACILMVLGVAVCGHAQSTSAKEPTASISGKVTFHAEGVKGVIVALRSMEPTSFRKLTSYRGVTNAKGEYRIANVPPGNYSVSPTATAFVFEGDSNGGRSLIINGSETVEDFDFSLIRGGVITGRVVDSDGRPVIEEEVYLSPDVPSYGSPLPAAITDDRGIYRIFGLKPGKYKVAAGKNDVGPSPSGPPRGAVYSRTYYPGGTDPAQAIVIQISDGSEATNVDITFGRTLTRHTASGRVVNGQTGQPLPDVRYNIIQFFGPSSTSSHRGSLTNNKGEFKLENLTPGQYAIFITPEEGKEWRSEELRFTIVDEDVTGLVVKTEKGASLAGMVVLDGPYDSAVREQLNNLKLIIFVATEKSLQRGGTMGMETRLRPDGSFRFGGLQAGSASFLPDFSQHFQITRIERAGIIQTGGALEIKQGEDITGVRIVLGYGDGSINGRVMIENGTIPANGRIFLRARKMNDNPQNTWIDATTRIDARGQFVIDNLFPGTYELTAGVLVQGSRAPLGPTKQQVVVTAGSTTNTTIRLDLNVPQLKP
ncbi:MAG TPA: hypothetical protein VJP89_19020 [Pyrinomonadaceae bacterium]|nr:hypothetical protein [Pyrinomonadaceae bacterium]